MKLTLLISTNFAVHCLCKLTAYKPYHFQQYLPQSSGSDMFVLAYQSFLAKIWLHLLFFFLGKASEHFMLGKRHSRKVVLFEHNSTHSQDEPLCYDQGRADWTRAVSN